MMVPVVPATLEEAESGRSPAVLGTVERDVLLYKRYGKVARRVEE
jgi:hypothetical protein